MNIKECMRKYFEENKIDGLYNKKHNCHCLVESKDTTKYYFMHCEGVRGLECLAARQEVVTKTEMVPVWLWQAELIN